MRQCFCTWFIFYIVECQAVISVQKAYKTVLILSFAYFLPFFEEKYNSCAIRARFVRNLYAYKYLYIRINTEGGAFITAKVNQSYWEKAEVSVQEAWSLAKKNTNKESFVMGLAEYIAKKYGTQLIYLTLHMDETTPHFHFSLKNYDENGLSLWKKNQNKEFLSQLQDIAFEHFKELGMQRGLSKDITGKKYETIQKYHIRKEMELRDKVLNTQANYDKLQKEVEKDLKSLYTEVNLKKNEVKDLRSNYDRTSQEYKNLTIVFKQLQQEEKTLREKVRELKEIDNLDNYLKDLKQDIRKIVNSNVEQVDPLIGSIRLEVVDINKMYRELISKISEPLHSKVKEVEEKDKTIEKLKEDIVFKNKEIIQKDTKIKDLTQTTKQLESAFMVNYKQLEAMKKDFKTKVANQVRRLNLIHRLRNSNIANKIRLRLSKKLNSNQIDR